MHSHLGVESWPALDATLDTNELSNPITPFVQSIDAFNPNDPAREWIVSGGVTTSLILPGSVNVMGGEAYIRTAKTLSVDDMLVETGVEKEERWRYLKMACGENPKRNYVSEKGQAPTSQLGEGWLERGQFEMATQLKRAQDDWCSAAGTLVAKKKTKGGRSATTLDRPFPEDLRYDTLVGVLRDDVKLNAYCYEPQDLESLGRHSNVFQFQIAAFHDAMEAYRVPEILKRAYKSLPTLATFGNMYGYKKEAYKALVWVKIIVK